MGEREMMNDRGREAYSVRCSEKISNFLHCYKSNVTCYTIRIQLEQFIFVLVIDRLEYLQPLFSVLYI